MRLFRRWDAKLSTEDTNGFLAKLAQVHIDRINSPVVREHFHRCLADGLFPDLCDYPLAHQSLSVADLIAASQVQAFYSKRKDLDFGFDRRAEALRKFIASERTCLEMNEHFRAWKRGGFQFLPRVEHALCVAQRKIARVLGDVPSLEELHVRFGPGATTQLPKRMACAKLKLSQPLACSGDMAPLLEEALATLPHLLPEGDVVTASVEIHPGKLVTVPKNAKTDRTVMIEPWLNSFFQLGVGEYMADRLLAVGVDLKRQEKNKSLAREGSLTGELATLDLSSASDTISVGLVEHLLPWDWYLFLSQLRTSIVEVDGTKTTLQKFSSMGNGFTFPLESLIFWALSSAAVGSENTVSVYGDDIIVPTHKVDHVVEVLNGCGFTVNMEKSFWSGPFRESCGGDYYFGIDVRPCYIKDRMSGHDAFRLHNFFKTRLDDESADLVLSYIDPAIRLFGPEGFGDGVLVSADYPKTYSKRIRQRGWGGHLFDSWTYSRRTFRRLTPGDRLLPTYSIYMLEDELEEESPERGPFELIARRFLSAIGLRPRRGMKFGRDGVAENDLPGTRGCKRISIYTLGR